MGEIEEGNGIEGLLSLGNIKNRISAFQKKEAADDFKLNQLFESKVARVVNSLESVFKCETNGDTVVGELGKRKTGLMTGTLKENVMARATSTEKNSHCEQLARKEEKLRNMRYLSAVELFGTRAKQSLKRRVSPRICGKDNSVTNYYC